jgi:hypothetical protein
MKHLTLYPDRQGGDLNRYFIIPSLTVGVQLFKSCSTEYVICSYIIRNVLIHRHWGCRSGQAGSK